MRQSLSLRNLLKGRGQHIKGTNVEKRVFWFAEGLHGSYEKTRDELLDDKILRSCIVQ